MKKKLMYGGIGAVVFLFALTVAGFSQLTPKLPRDKTLIVDILSGRDPNPRNFNVWIPGGGHADKGIQQLMVRPLWMSGYVKGEVLNVLAKEPPIYNEDFTKMTVKLRKGIYWSDGIEFTADDVVFTVKTVMDNPGMLYSSELNLYVDRVYKSDDYTVVFELKKPNSRFHTYFLDRWGTCRIMPKHIWKRVEDPMKFDFYPPVSLGAYVLKDLDPTGYWFLWERRKDWDRTVVGKLYGEPKPKYVLFRYYGPPEKKVMAQARHELDMCDLTPETLRATLEKNKYARAYRKKFPWVVNVDPCITGASFNCDKYPFKIKDVRWALVLAMDIVDVDMIAFDGTGTIGCLLLAPTPVHQEWYYKPMESWLRNFTLDIEVSGEPFKPYDPNVPFRLAKECAKRGYEVPVDPEEIRKIWGYGWWKYAPQVAEKLLERHGFKRGKNGKWLLPDGTPWKITIVSHPNPAHPMYRNAFAIAQQWRRFGIDVKVETTEMYNTLVSYGKFDCSTDWPTQDPWGCHPDLFRTFRAWYSKYYRPIGKPAMQITGGASRWKDERIDHIVDELKKTAFNNVPKIIELGIEGLKVVTEEMPGIPTVAYPGVVAWDEYYWTNYPGAENPYTQPYHHWPNFGFMLPFLEPTGRK